MLNLPKKWSMHATKTCMTNLSGGTIMDGVLSYTLISTVTLYVHVMYKYCMIQRLAS